MKKVFPIFILVVILASCANLPDITELTTLLISPTPTAADTPTPKPTVTTVPTIDLFAVSTATPVTFTPTVAPVITGDVPTVTLIPTSTLIPLPTFSEEFINDNSKLTFFVQNVGFRLVSYSAPVLYWDQGSCTTRSIKITVLVEDPERTDRVFLFLRLRDKTNTLNVGEWSAGAEMIKIDNGSFNYTVQTDNLRRYFYYKNAWIEYQLVSVNKKLEILGRTQLYDRNLSLVRCGF